jgi:hypothetical protein
MFTILAALTAFGIAVVKFEMLADFLGGDDED